MTETSVLIDSNLNCPICQNPSQKYHEFSDTNYHRCSSCGLLFLHPRPTVDTMLKYAEEQYKGGVYEDYTKARELKIATFQRRIQHIIEYIPKGRLLDLGCSCGFMIEAALDAGFDAYGIEFSESAIKAARASIQKRIYHNDINDLDSLDIGKFDVVSAFDILEHTQNPVTVLENWSKLLNPGGILIICTPDTDHFLKSLLGRKWPMLQPYQHTFLFSRSNFKDVFSKVKLKPLKIIPTEKVMTLQYLLGQIEIHLPIVSRVGTGLGKLIPFIMKRPIPFKIGEFLAIGQKNGNDDRDEVGV